MIKTFDQWVEAENQNYNQQRINKIMIKTFDQWVEAQIDLNAPANGQGGVMNDLDQQLEKGIRDAAAKGDYATARQYRDMLMQRQKNLANRAARPPQKPTPQPAAAPTPPPGQPYQQDPSQDPIGPWRSDYSQIRRDMAKQQAQQGKQGFIGKLRGLFGGG